jgi:hypothetical protein
MTGTEILNTIHAIYEQDTSYPETSSDDYAIRLVYVNQAILTWQNEVFNGFLWAELYKSVTNPLSTTSISDFLYPEKFYLENYEFEYVLPHEGVQNMIEATNNRIYWITGGAGNKVVNIYPGASGTGNYTISYYKEATLFNSGNIGNHVEMTNPNFVIQYVLAQLYATDGDQNLFNQSMNMANQYLAQMKTGFNTMPLSSFSNIEDDNVGFGV